MFGHVSMKDMPPQAKKIPVFVVALSPHHPHRKENLKQEPSQSYTQECARAQLARALFTPTRSGPQLAGISAERAEPRKLRNPFRATFSHISRSRFGTQKPLLRIFLEIAFFAPKISGSFCKNAKN